MIDLMETTNKNQFMNGLEKNQNIDIVDYQTVSFDSNARKAKRSLSLNVYSLLFTGQCREMAPLSASRESLREAPALVRTLEICPHNLILPISMRL